MGRNAAAGAAGRAAQSLAPATCTGCARQGRTELPQQQRQPALKLLHALAQVHRGNASAQTRCRCSEPNASAQNQ